MAITADLERRYRATRRRMDQENRAAGEPSLQWSEVADTCRETAEAIDWPTEGVTTGC